MRVNTAKISKTEIKNCKDLIQLLIRISHNLNSKHCDLDVNIKLIAAYQSRS